MRVIIIAAVARNGVIGKEGGLPWHLPEDFRQFRDATQGHAVVMGRATFASIGKPLPERFNVVLSRTMQPPADGSFAVCRSLDEALRLCEERGHAQAFIIGGAQVYREALRSGVGDELLLSELHAEHEGDTLFPSFDPAAWSEESRIPQQGFDVVRYRKLPAGPANGRKA